LTDAPISRKTHITRLVGTNKNGDVLQDIWVDLERIEIAKSRTQTPDGVSQGLQRKFLWADDPDDGDTYNEDGPPSRITTIVKVCDVENEVDPNDPEEWIPVRAIKALKASGGDGTGQNYMDRLVNEALQRASLTDARKVTVRRIVHYDTNIDDAAQKAFDADPTRKAYVVSGDQYQVDTTTKNKDQYVEHEIIEYLKHKTDEGTEEGGVTRGVQTKLLNDHLVEQSDESTGAVVGNNGINPPYRLDPYQNIVNVKFATLYLVVSLGGSNGSFSRGPYGNAPSVAAPSVSSKPNNNMSGVKLLDTFNIPAGNTSGSGFINCFDYNGPLAPQVAWLLFNTTGLAAGEFAAVNNSCPWPGPGPVPDNIVPIDFQAFATAATDYLYSIPARDGVVSVSVGDIASHSSSGDHVSTEVIIDGSGTIFLSVYSTVRGKKITKLNQLIDYDGDGKPRPTEDDICRLAVTSKNQGKFLVNVHLEKDKSKVQTDNYGKKFQPYKVTLDHGDTQDVIPGQPPPVLPLPQK